MPGRIVNSKCSQSLVRLAVRYALTITYRDKVEHTVATHTKNWMAPNGELEFDHRKTCPELPVISRTANGPTHRNLLIYRNLEHMLMSSN
jgi:hypothetical protein